MSNIAKHEIKIAFDNAGGAVLASKTYAHVYSDGKQLATDVRALLDGGDTDEWDGNDEEVCVAFRAEADRYERVYRMSEIECLAEVDGPIENLGVTVIEDERRVEIHWGSGSRPQSGSGFMEFEFWAALLA